jgi:hypothetical protein
MTWPERLEVLLWQDDLMGTLEKVRTGRSGLEVDLA